MNEIYISTDVEADGPIPGDYSMLSFASVAYEDGKEIDHFYMTLDRLPGAGQDPGTMAWWSRNIDAYEKTRILPRRPEVAMEFYVQWLDRLAKRGTLVFVAYPVTFDFTFIYWYLMHFVKRCPFGFSGLDIKTLAMAQMQTDFKATTKRAMPKAWFDADKPHTHDPLDDAREQGALYHHIHLATQGFTAEGITQAKSDQMTIDALTVQLQEYERLYGRL